MLEVGDKIRITDGSWSIGIKNGRLHVLSLGHYNIKEFILIAKDLRVVADVDEYEDEKINGTFNMVADILVTDGEGNYWFTFSRFAKKIVPRHTIIFDGGPIIEISHESYTAWRVGLDS